MDVDDVVFLDVEADRADRLLAIGAVRAGQTLYLDVAREGRRAAERLALFVRDSPVGGHNLLGHDLPLLEASPFSWSWAARPLLDTLLLSLLADPARPSHALDKGAQEPGTLPDPVADARSARQRAIECFTALAEIPVATAAFYAALLAGSGHDVLAARLRGLAGAAPAGVREALDLLPEALLERLCRVQLRSLLESVLTGEPSERVALALAVRFVEVAGASGRVAGPPSPALARQPRFGELLTRLLGPLCPDHACPHRGRCEVHRPFAEEILERNFELSSFRPGQREIVHAVLEGRQPLVVLPTGGGKSLCYQLPAVHGADRLHGLTVVISPLQALMADQVGALSRRYPATCFINSQLTMAERQEHLAGLRTGKYNIVYLGPEQLRNPSIRRLLHNRPPFLWVIDEAHCISQWGHGFRTDYTYLPRAIAELHQLRAPGAAPAAGPERLPPLVALFTATATAEVRDDIAAQVERGLGAKVELLDRGAQRENLAYEVLAVTSDQQKDDQLETLLEASPDGARLVYCATVRTARRVAETLREREIPTALYHGRLAPREKADELARFLGNEVRTIVATSAFGMGIDKPDIRLVVHYELSGSLEDYVQETGRAGRDGEPARCVLLYSEQDLETQFYLKTASHVTARDVRFVFRALRARARRMGRAGSDGRVELWVVPEDLFAEERLDLELDWDRDELSTKLKLVLYHLEADGVLERRENRTRAFGIFPALPSLALAEEKLPESASPATRRVLRYLYDPERPHRISILDLADEAGLLPAAAFRELQALAKLGVVKQDLVFEITLARGVTDASREVAARRFETLAALFELGEALDEQPVLALRPAAAEIGRRLGRRVAPHDLFHALRALRRQGLVRLDKAGRDRYRVRFEPDAVGALDELRSARQTALALLEHAERLLGDRRGRDVRCELDVDRFLAESPDLFQQRSADDVVRACLLLHHLEAWHLADPPVVLETALRVAVDPRARLRDLDPARAERQLEHDILLVHLLRGYALRDARKRRAYLGDYFTLPREAFLARHFHKERRPLIRPVSPVVEAELLHGLTPAQQDAVTADDRAVLVVAGPGSGKTHAIVRRIAHRVRARQVRPQEILVLAFNRAAAAELRRRLEIELGPRAATVHVHTFHGFALRLTGDDLRDEARDADQLLDQVLGRAADLLEPPVPEGEDAAAPDPAEVEARRLQVLGSIRHVIVDEYQDLDADQYRLLSALVGLRRGKAGARDRTERTVYVVGDDDQAIYGFRKASVEFLRRYEEDFGARRICLADNFRSSARLVATTSAFVAAVPGRMKVKPEEQVRPAPGAPAGDADAVRRFRYADDRSLAAHAAFIVQKSLDATGGSVAVLARHWAALDPVRWLLEREKIPFRVHHAAFHRPAHRRYPASRLLRKLVESPAPLEGPAAAHLRDLVRAMERSSDEPPLASLIGYADALDSDRLLASGRYTKLTAAELTDELLLASRDSALRDRGTGDGSVKARVHLCTFHGSKGLEFDKVIALPCRLRPDTSAEDAAAERRAFYVAMTRARTELILATLGAPGELALEVDALERDLRPVSRRLPGVRAGYLDCEPSDCVLTSRELAAAQRTIARLKEGDPLELSESPNAAPRLLAGGCLAAVLSAGGRRRFDALRRRAPGPIEARVHEIFVHLVRDGNGNVKRRWLVAVPGFRAGG